MPSIDDDDLCFEDGNLVVSANNRTNGDLVFFRVHKSILGKHSPVFKDMYSVPPPQDVDQHNGVPLVHVHDDANDLRHFLKAIYDPRQCLLPRLIARRCSNSIAVSCPLADWTQTHHHW